MWMKVNGKHAIAANDNFLSFCPPAKKWMYRGGQKWQKGNITLKGKLCSKKLKVFREKDNDKKSGILIQLYGITYTLQLVHRDSSKIN